MWRSAAWDEGAAPARSSHCAAQAAHSSPCKKPPSPVETTELNFDGVLPPQLECPATSGTSAGLFAELRSSGAGQHSTLAANVAAAFSVAATSAANVAAASSSRHRAEQRVSKAATTASLSSRSASLPGGPAALRRPQRRAGRARPPGGSTGGAGSSPEGRGGRSGGAEAGGSTGGVGSSAEGCGGCSGDAEASASCRQHSANLKLSQLRR